jgi:hypothetical protein
MRPSRNGAVARYTLSAALLKGSFRTRWPEAA